MTRIITPATKRARQVEHELKRARIEAALEKGPRPIPLPELPRILNAIQQLPLEEARCLKFLMLTAARPSEVCALRVQQISDRAWKPGRNHAWTLTRPLSAASLHLVRGGAGGPNSGRSTNPVFYTSGGVQFTTHHILKALRSIDPKLSSLSFRVTFAEWALTGHYRAVCARLALGHVSGEDRQVFSKFGAANYLPAMAGARLLVEEWASICT